MADMQAAFSELRRILLPYGERLEVTADTDQEYSLYTHHTMKNGQPLYFGGVYLKARYVSYYLMPVYVSPQLLNDLSLGLKKRMQGKSCFNFTVPDEVLFGELSELTATGFRDYERQGYA